MPQKVHETDEVAKELGRNDATLEEIKDEFTSPSKVFEDMKSDLDILDEIRDEFGLSPPGTPTSPGEPAAVAAVAGEPHSRVQPPEPPVNDTIVPAPSDSGSPVSADAASQGSLVPTEQAVGSASPVTADAATAEAQAQAQAAASSDNDSEGSLSTRTIQQAADGVETSSNEGGEARALESEAATGPKTPSALDDAQAPPVMSNENAATRGTEEQDPAVDVAEHSGTPSGSDPPPLPPSVSAAGPGGEGVDTNGQSHPANEQETPEASSEGLAGDGSGADVGAGIVDDQVVQNLQEHENGPQNDTHPDLSSEKLVRQEGQTSVTIETGAFTAKGSIEGAPVASESITTARTTTDQVGDPSTPGAAAYPSQPVDANEPAPGAGQPGQPDNGQSSENATNKNGPGGGDAPPSAHHPSSSAVESNATKPAIEEVAKSSTAVAPSLNASDQAAPLNVSVEVQPDPTGVVPENGTKTVSSLKSTDAAERANTTNNSSAPLSARDSPVGPPSELAAVAVANADPSKGTTASDPSSDELTTNATLAPPAAAVSTDPDDPVPTDPDDSSTASGTGSDDDAEVVAPISSDPKPPVPDGIAASTDDTTARASPDLPDPPSNTTPTADGGLNENAGGNVTSALEANAVGLEVDMVNMSAGSILHKVVGDSIQKTVQVVTGLMTRSVKNATNNTECAAGGVTEHHPDLSQEAGAGHIADAGAGISTSNDAGTSNSPGAGAENGASSEAGSANVEEGLGLSGNGVVESSTAGVDVARESTLPQEAGPNSIRESGGTASGYSSAVEGQSPSVRPPDPSPVQVDKIGVVDSEKKVSVATTEVVMAAAPRGVDSCLEFQNFAEFKAKIQKKLAQKNARTGGGSMGQSAGQSREDSIFITLMDKINILQINQVCSHP